MVSVLMPLFAENVHANVMLVQITTLSLTISRTSVMPTCV